MLRKGSQRDCFVFAEHAHLTKNLKVQVARTSLKQKYPNRFLHLCEEWPLVF